MRPEREEAGNLLLANKRKMGVVLFYVYMPKLELRYALQLPGDKDWGVAAWVKTILPVIHQSIRNAMPRLHTSHQDIRTYFSDTTAAKPTTTTSTPPTATTAPTINTARTIGVSE
jgi:hypothetical protein